MSLQPRQLIQHLGLAALATLALSACIMVDVHSHEDRDHHREQHSTVNDDVHISAGSTGGDVSSVNGNIHIREGAQVQRVEAVNGDITLEPQALAHSIESVNGAVHLHSGARIRNDINKVNGRLLLEQASIAGDVDQVNGELSLNKATIEGDVSIVNTRIKLLDHSRILGSVTVEDTRHTQHKPLITLGPGTEIAGTLILHRPVELQLDPQARIGAIEYRYAATTP